MIIQPLFKKCDPEIPDNYRGISLLSICSKLYSYILNKRLTCWTDDNNLLSETHCGFRKTYSTTDHLFTLLALIQKQLLCNKELYVAFIDFMKAIDSVTRTKLWAILRKNSLKELFFYQALVNMYTVVKSKIWAGNDLTESFMCPRGL